MRDGGLCGFCGRVADEIDHVRPASHFVKGAAREVVIAPTNLVAFCARCNNVKAGSGLEGFVEKLLSLGLSERKAAALRSRVDAATSRELADD